MTSPEKKVVKTENDTCRNGISRSVFNRYYPRLVGFAVSIIGNEEDAKDIVQDSFIHLMERNFLINEDSSIQQLLFLTVRNACLNFLKHQIVKNKYSTEYKKCRQGEKLYYADFCNDTMHKLVCQELKEQIDKIILNIPERSREAFVYSRQLGMQRGDIAEKMSISPKMVDKHLKKAIQIIKNKIKDSNMYGISITALHVLNYIKQTLI